MFSVPFAITQADQSSALIWAEGKEGIMGKHLTSHQWHPLLYLNVLCTVAGSDPAQRVAFCGVLLLSEAMNGR